MGVQYMNTTNIMEITNPRICQFYHDHADINLETVNLLFIDLLEKLLYKRDDTVSETLQSQLFSLLSNNTTQLTHVSQSILSLQSTLPQTHSNIILDMISKFTEIQKEYISHVNKSIDDNKENNPTLSQEKHLSTVLTKMYNSSEVQNQHKNANTTTTGPILLKRQRKYNILISNKDNEDNISLEDVQTFFTLIDEQNCNGIFISQNSGIFGKKNYQIELHNNNIVVFVHHGQYNPAKIEIAVDIIDQLSSKMRQFKHQTDEECSIPKELLDTINNEYQLFLSQKTAVIEVFKESQKKVLSQIDEIRFPSLDKYLATKYSAPLQKPGLKCDLCKSFSGNNLKALAAHKRGCIRKLAISPITAPTPVPIPQSNSISS